MDKVRVSIEVGEKRVFVCAIDWPGWCRSGKSEELALQALVDYGPRYGQILAGKGFDYVPPTDISALLIAEKHKGDTTTDFGAPSIQIDGDKEPIDQKDFLFFSEILKACWEAFDSATKKAAGKDLRKGPRGGGRDREKIVEHVLEAERAYMRSLTAKSGGSGRQSVAEQLEQVHQEIINALQVAVHGGLPEHGPRGGALWPARYFVRRTAWHVLDHAWEIEDRIM